MTDVQRWRCAGRPTVVSVLLCMGMVGGMEQAWGQRITAVDDAHASAGSLDQACTATASAQTNGCFVFHQNGSGVCLLGYVGGATNKLEIPREIRGKSVNRIDRSAFTGCGFGEVVIPDSIEEIGPFAFAGCSNLVALALPVKVKRINDFTFMNCSALANVAVGPHVEQIGRMAFAGCEKLESLVLPVSVRQIEDGAFIQTRLRAFAAPAALVDIGTGAFAQCSQLTNVVFSAVGIAIQENAFGDCTQLAEITFLGTVREVAQWSFTGCPKLQRVRFKNPPSRLLDPAAFKDSRLVAFYQVNEKGDSKLERLPLFKKVDAFLR